MTDVADLITEARDQSPGNVLRGGSDRMIVRVMSQMQRRLMARWPERFNQTKEVAPADSKWSPGAHTRMLFITKTDGTVVHFTTQEGIESENPPLVYYIGTEFFAPAGATEPGAADPLVFQFGIVPDKLTADGNVHPLFPPEAEQLLVLAGAKLLAGRNARIEELQDLRTEITEQIADFDKMCATWLANVQGDTLSKQSKSEFWPVPPGRAVRLVTG